MMFCMSANYRRQTFSTALIPENKENYKAIRPIFYYALNTTKSKDKFDDLEGAHSGVALIDILNGISATGDDRWLTR